MNWIDKRIIISTAIVHLISLIVNMAVINYIELDWLVINLAILTSTGIALIYLLILLLTFRVDKKL